MPFELQGTPGWISWVFLIVLVALCAGAWSSRRALLAGEELPPPAVLYPSIALQLGVLGALAWAAAWDARIELFATRAPGLEDALIGLAALAVMLASAWPVWRLTSPDERARRARLLPSTRGERLWMLLVSALAGISEELAWRGVLPALVAHWTGGVLLPVLVAALLFGLGHLVQGRLATGVVFVFALVFHGLVAFTGGLWVAIVVHASYDALIGVWIGPLLHRRQAAARGG